MPRRIVLVSDLQQGSRLEALGEFEWPSDVELEIKTVADDSPNAGLQRLAEPADAASAGPDAGPASACSTTPNRVASGSPCNGPAPSGAAIGEPVDVYVPPGESRVVRVPRAKGIGHGPGHRRSRATRAPSTTRSISWTSPGRGDRAVRRRRSARRSGRPALLPDARLHRHAPPHRQGRRPAAVGSRFLRSGAPDPPGDPRRRDQPRERPPPQGERARRRDVALRGRPSRPGRDPRGAAGCPARPIEEASSRATSSSARSPSITRSSRRSPARNTAISPRSTSGSIASRGRRIEWQGFQPMTEKAGAAAIPDRASWPLRERRSRRPGEADRQGERGRHGERLESRRQPARAVVEVRPADDGAARSPRPAAVRRRGAHGRRPDRAARPRDRSRGLVVHKPSGATIAMARGASVVRPGGRAGDLHGRRGRRPAVVRREPRPVGEQDRGVERRDARAVRLPAGQSHAEVGRPGAAPAVAQRRAGGAPEALAMADPRDHRHTDRGNRPGGSDQADPPGDAQAEVLSS